MSDPAEVIALSAHRLRRLSEAKRDVETVNRFLSEGYAAEPKPGVWTSRSAIRMAAEHLGVPRQTMEHRIGSPTKVGSHLRIFGIQPDWTLENSHMADKARALRGESGTEPVLAGFALKRTTLKLDKDGAYAGEYITQTRAPGEAYAIPEGHVVKGESALVDADGRTTQKWVKTAIGRTPEQTVEEIRAALREMPERAEPVPAPVICDADLATVYPLPDLHIGLLTWRGETGVSWDLKIAQRTIMENVGRLFAATPSSEEAVILGLGDLLHADGYDNATPKSKNVLDVDGRYPRILDVAVEMLREMVRQALRKHKRVTLRILPGNHDPESTVAVNLALRLFYESDPRVTVDASASPFWWWRFGVNLLGATHGDAAKMPDLPLIMATSVDREDWAASQVREIHTGHIHQESKRDIRGILVESHRTPIPPDGWHFRHGYGGGRSMCAITYHRTLGRYLRNEAMILAPDATALQVAA